MIKYTFNIDQKIKDKFRLFAGVRDVEEDQKIYDKVLEASFDELISFLEDNLSKDQIEGLTQKLQVIFDANLSEDDKDEKTTEVLLEYAGKINNFRFLWDKRIDYFLNRLVYSSIKKKHD